jgi:putative transposase
MVRELLRDLWQANPTWGSPCIVGELQKLSIHVANSTVETYRPRSRKPSSPPWRAFLNTHIKDLVSCDFFTMPTVTFKVLCVFVILAHDRRRIVHVNATQHPTAQWTAQHVVEAVPWDEALRYRLHDRESVYATHVRQRMRHIRIEEVLSAPPSPWQNPSVERVIGRVRRERLDHAILINAQHLRRLLTQYMDLR